MDGNLWWFIGNTILFIITLFSFIGASLKDPGYLKKPKDIDFLVNLLNLFY